MKTEAEKLKLRIFLAILVILAFCINARFSFQGREIYHSIPTSPTYAIPSTQSEPVPQPKQEPAPEPEPIQRMVKMENNEVATRNAAEDAARERARFIARYVNEGFKRTPGVKMVAIAAASEKAKMNRAVSSALINHLKSDGVGLDDSIFKPEFVFDGLLQKALDRPDQIFAQLNLSDALDAVLLARQEVEYITNTTLENVLTARMKLTVSFFPSGGESQSWTFIANGAGFKQDAARLQAEERLLKQIANDTKMVLYP